MADRTLTPRQRSLLAAELVLGLLEGEDLVEAKRLRLSDPQFAAEVEGWTARFAPLFDQFLAEPPPPHIWDTITSRLADNDDEPVTTVEDQPSSQSSSLWKGWAVASTAIAAVLAFFLLAPSNQPMPDGARIPVAQASGQQVIASLSGDQQDLSVAVRFDPAAGGLNVRTQGIADGDLAPELWVVPADGKPRSLGLIPVNGEGTVDIDAVLAGYLHDGALLALTMEERGSAPHPSPTSDIIASGTISKI